MIFILGIKTNLALQSTVNVTCVKFINNLELVCFNANLSQRIRVLERGMIFKIDRKRLVIKSYLQNLSLDQTLQSLQGCDSTGSDSDLHQSIFSRNVIYEILRESRGEKQAISLPLSWLGGEGSQHNTTLTTRIVEFLKDNINLSYQIFSYHTRKKDDIKLYYTTRNHISPFLSNNKCYWENVVRRVSAGA